MIFQQIKAETTVIPHFCVILTVQFISGTNFVIRVILGGRRSISRSKGQF